MKPQTAWIIVGPYGVPWLDSGRWLRKWCVKEFERERGRPWAQLQKEGFRVAKVRIEEAR